MVELQSILGRHRSLLLALLDHRLGSFVGWHGFMAGRFVGLHGRWDSMEGACPFANGRRWLGNWATPMRSEPAIAPTSRGAS